MSDEIDKLLTAYPDLYASPKQDQIFELESKIGKLDFDGIHIGAPEVVEPLQEGIPTITLTGSTMLREYEVDDLQNSVIIANDLDRSDIRIVRLYKPPTKRLKPTPKGAKPADLATDAMSFGAHHRIVGEKGDLEPGVYSVSVIEWDRVSNIRTVVKKPKPGAPPIKLPVPQWPWELWKTQAEDFLAKPGSPKLDGEIGLAVEAVGTDEKAVLLGSFGTKARPVHVIAADPGTVAAKSDIRAGVPVDLLQFTLDKTAPERIRILVPIKTAAPVKTGDVAKGWFAYPLANLQRKEETLVYVFVDGMRSGPLRIPGLKP